MLTICKTIKNILEKMAINKERKLAHDFHNNRRR